jgi:hypothetical protein
MSGVTCDGCGREFERRPSEAMPGVTVLNCKVMGYCPDCGDELARLRAEVETLRWERNATIEMGFNRAWTACVGTPAYDKSTWLACDAQLAAAVRAAAGLDAKEGE